METAKAVRIRELLALAPQPIVAPGRNLMAQRRDFDGIGRLASQVNGAFTDEQWAAFTELLGLLWPHLDEMLPAVDSAGPVPDMGGIPSALGGEPSQKKDADFTPSSIGLPERE